jgi:hypothetical protein
MKRYSQSSTRHTLNPGRCVLALILGGLLAGAASGCSDEGKGGGSPSAPKQTGSTTAKRVIPILTSSTIPPGQRLRGDGDADNPRDFDGNGDGDGSEDHDQDYPVPAGYRLPDSDDRAIFAYGHPPSAGERAAIGRVVKRYYVAASAGDGATACSLLPASLARSLPEDYGRSSGPAYLRGARTCQAIASKLFARMHEQLAEAITIVEVRVKGSSAQVVLSSRKMPASDIQLLRQDGAWKVEELIGQPLS